MNVTATIRSRAGGRIRNFLKLIDIEVIINVVTNRSIIHDICWIFPTMDPKDFNRCRNCWGRQNVPAYPGMARVSFKKERRAAPVQKNSMVDQSNLEKFRRRG
jgi:hypothetical protein